MSAAATLAPLSDLGLDALAARANAEEAAGGIALGLASAHYLAAGEALAEAKVRCIDADPPIPWLAWLEGHWDYDVRTAQRRMRCWREREHLPRDILSYDGQTEVLKALASEEGIEELLEELLRGLTDEQKRAVVLAEEARLRAKAAARAGRVKLEGDELLWDKTRSGLGRALRALVALGDEELLAAVRRALVLWAARRAPAA